MDRSYLSNQAVVEASRQFVCVRLATYEDQGEADFLTSLYRFRGDVLKNSVFALLDPTGEKHLDRPGRSPKHTFRDAAEMAKRMREIGDDFAKKKSTDSPSALGLPYLKSVRLALNVAACDAQRLVIVYAPREADRCKLEAELTPLLWSDDLVGHLLCVATSDAVDLKNIEGATEAAGLLIVEPTPYGDGARQIAHVKLGASRKKSMKTLVAAAQGNEMGSVDSKRHIGRGLRRRVQWKTEIEVEDPTQIGRRRRN